MHYVVQSVKWHFPRLFMDIAHSNPRAPMFLLFISTQQKPRYDWTIMMGQLSNKLCVYGTVGRLADCLVPAGTRLFICSMRSRITCSCDLRAA